MNDFISARFKHTFLSVTQVVSEMNIKEYNCLIKY
jgi:hypothetical protein